MKFAEVLSYKSRVKCIEAMAKLGEINISGLVEYTKMNHSVLRRCCQYFVVNGFLERKQFGRIVIYRYKIENIYARTLRELILFWDTNPEKKD